LAGYDLNDIIQVDNQAKINCLVLEKKTLLTMSKFNDIINC